MMLRSVDLADKFTNVIVRALRALGQSNQF